MNKIKRFKLRLKILNFGAEDQRMVFDFRTKFVEEVDILGVPEAHIYNPTQTTQLESRKASTVYP